MRPGRRDGGTTLVFTLKRGSIVRFTIVRLYPTCERIGSFSVRAHGGVNRVRFRGRLGGRPLGEGTYRLVGSARGQKSAAATVTIVVVRGKMSSAELRKALRANACSASEAHEIDTALGVARTGGDDDSAVKTKSVTDPVLGAVKAVVKKAKALPSAVGTGRRWAATDALSPSLVGLLAAVFAATLVWLGVLVLRVYRMQLRGQRLR